jgi:hypothetical protein
MSSTIEFNRWVIKTKPVGTYRRPYYFGFAESGKSNCFTDGGRIARDTSLLLIHGEYDFMGEIVRISVSCEGGMLKMGGRWVKPEGYIGAWRKAKEDALELEHYLEHTSMTIEFRSMVDQLNAKRATCDTSKPWQRDMVREIDDLIISLCTTDGVEETTVKWFGETIAVTRFTFTLANAYALMDLLVQAMDRGVKGRAIWRSHFSQHAYSRGLAQRQRSLLLVG